MKQTAVNFSDSVHRVNRWNERARMLVLGLVLAGGLAGTVLAQSDSPDVRFESLHVGNVGTVVLRVMQDAPKLVQRTSVLGVEHLVLVFESGRVRQQFMFVGGRLFAKTTTTKPSIWGLF